jgi:hypothetical protein
MENHVEGSKYIGKERKVIDSDDFFKDALQLYRVNVEWKDDCNWKHGKRETWVCFELLS